MMEKSDIDRDINRLIAELKRYKNKETKLISYSESMSAFKVWLDQKR